MAIDNRLQVFNEEGQSVDYDILASDVKFLPDGKDLPTKLAELEQEIEDAGSGDGTVTGVKVGSTTYEPTEGVVDISQGIPDVSGKANKSEMSVVPGTGANADKTTITLKEGTNATVLTQHQDISGKVDKDTNKELIPSTDLAKLQSLPTATELGNTYATKTELGQKANSADVYPKSQTYTKGEVDDLVDGIEAGERIVFDTEGTPIIDSPLSPDADSVLGAASARWVKEIDTNVKAILAALANIAFTTGKPTWQAVAKRKYDLTMNASTLTGCTGTVVSGDAGNGQVYEGGVRIKLTPTQASYAFTSVTVNGESAATTATGDADGSVYLDIVVNGNITVAATAISGRGIDFTGSTGCSIGAAGVAIGQDLDTTITANEHFTLPASITVKIGNTNVTHTYTRAQGNKTATLHIDAANITGDLTITCTADEDAHAILDLSSADFDGTTVDVKRDNVALSDDAHIYEDDVISIVPKSGKLVDVAAVYGSTPTDITLQGNVYDGYTFTVVLAQIGEDITIEGGTEALSTCSIDVSGVTSDVGVTWNTPSTATNSIAEGDAFSITFVQVGGTGVMAIGRCTMGSETLTATNNTISVSHVTGNITIVANVRDLPAKVHSYAFPATTDNSGECLEDTISNFNLYLYNDTTKSSFSAAYSNGFLYPTGYYANGVYDGYRGGKAGDGDRVNKITEFSDFTFVMKDVRPVYDSSNKVNNNNQQQIKSYDRNEVTNKAADWGSSKPNKTKGQFKLLPAHTASYYLQESGHYSLQLQYCNNSDTKTTLPFFTNYGNQGFVFPDTTIEKNGVTINAHTYHFVFTFNAVTLKCCLWLVSTDNDTETTIFSLLNEVTVDTPLRMPCIAVPNAASQFAGFDVYNYTMDETNIATEFNATLNTGE